jgi:hypothetical protein
VPDIGRSKHPKGKVLDSVEAIRTAAKLVGFFGRHGVLTRRQQSKYVSSSASGGSHSDGPNASAGVRRKAKNECETSKTDCRPSAQGLH